MTEHALFAQDFSAQAHRANTVSLDQTADQASKKSVYCFAVHANAEPGVMPRVLELFAKRNLIPASWHSILTAGKNGADELQIDIQVQQLEARVADHIARCLRQITYVETVLTSEKGYSNSALGA
jgi:acetolactate synthase small subunit